MQPQQNFSGGQGQADENSGIVCAQCGAPMPREMRFCRSCGNRLGEGPAEYTETVRLPNGATAQRFRGTTPFMPGSGGPTDQQSAGRFPYKPKRRLGGMTWVWIAIAIFFASGAGLTSLIPRALRRSRTAISVAVNRSYFGVDGFRTVDGGVSFDNVEPPGSPADKAGLVGGDIITSLDGRVVKDQGQAMDVLSQTPPGKTIEVIYMRDGEVRKTQLTTISQMESSQLEREFASRPEGIGRLGFDTSDARRVSTPETKTYGVRLNNFNSSGPAALAGIEKGDIITSIDNVPIRTVGELVSRVHRALPYSKVTMKVIRGTEQIEIPVKLGK